MVEIEPNDALFLDFDGTLADIVDVPNDANIPSSTVRDLIFWSDRLEGAVAIISGRDIQDLIKRSPGSIWRIGGHGLDFLAPGDGLASRQSLAPPAELSEAFSRLAQSADGAWLERKGPILTLHYRGAAEHASRLISEAERAVEGFASYRVEVGKMIVEAKPDAACKGRALRALMEQHPFLGRRPVAVGDDTTDEDLFAAAQELGGIGIKVGAGESIAKVRAPSPESVRNWLSEGASQ